MYSKRLYEYEFLLNIELWTGKKHWLNRSDIIVFVHRDSIVQLGPTMKKARHINENILFHIYDGDFQFLFANKMYTNFLFETLPVFDKYKYGLAFDLDLFLCSEVNFEFFKEQNVFFTYPESSYFDDDFISARARRSQNLYNTELQVINRQNMLNKIVWDKFLQDRELYNKYYALYGFNNNSQYFYEECFYEYLFAQNILNCRNHITLPDDVILGELDKKVPKPYNNSFNVYISFLREQVKTRNLPQFMHYHLANIGQMVQLKKFLLSI